MMNRMKKVMTVMLVSSCLVLLACGNKDKKTEPIIYEDQSDIEELLAGTVANSAQIDASKEKEDSSTRVDSSSFSSHTSKSMKYDNMRGFDPASEDDMEDNGISRYMENNDDEGWD